MSAARTAALAAALLAATLPVTRAPLLAQADETADRARDLEGCDPFGPCLDPLTIESAPVDTAVQFPPPDYFAKGPEPIVVDPVQGQQHVIGGGFAVPDRTAPWMAQIQRPPRLLRLTARNLGWDERHHCSGALIKPGWIITAAHCLDDTLDLAGNVADIRQLNYRVRLGRKDISLDPSGSSFRIVRIERPSGYDPSRSGYFSDVALVQYVADEQTDAARGVQAVVLPVDRRPASQQVFGTAIVRFYGYGLTERGRIEAPLLYGKALIAPDSQCRNPAIALCGRQIASIGIPGRQSSQCHGDSGGPLVWFRDGKRPMLIGVVSHNVGKASCGRHRDAGVFTRISAFVGWIERIAGPLPRG